MKKSSSKIKKIRKIIFTILIISLIIFIILLSQYERILKNQNSLEYETQKKTITEFQTERWNEIRKAVFGAGADSLSDVLNVNIATMSVQANNEYFNWADTSKLGITPWNGSTESISTTRTETESYSDSYINGATNAKTSVSESITYTVIDVNNAEQLRWALEQYHSSASNIKINLKSDIDLNGQNGKVWQSIKLSRANTNDVGWLYFEGNNHTIYNMKNCGSGYTHGNGFFGDISNKTFIAKNLKFVSSMVINNVVGQETDIKGMGTLFGVVNNQPSKYGVYIDNVKAISVFMQTSDKVGTAGGGGLIGRLNHAAYNDNVFIKNCASEKVYIAGIDHVGGFSGCICNANRDDGYHVKYNAEFPEQPEAFLKKAAIFPTMIENCFSVDSEVFSTGADSGAFISCGGVFIVRNCFTNNTIYANSETGAFIGKLFTRVYDNNPTDSTPYSDSLYDDAGVRSVSLYMENCYSSGIIEGNKNIGGFIGITNFTQYDCTSAIIKNCYSSAMVGMEYSGEAVGGFIGSGDSAVKLGATVNIGGQTITAKSDVFVDCYAVGEVGDITTNTDNNSLNTSTLGGFIGDYTSRSTGVKFINCYYDKQTTGMRERGIGYVSDNSTGSIEGLTGTYTQGSTLKGGTPGLTGKTGNIVSMLDSESWVQKKGLYPQLAVFDSKASEIFKEDADLVRCYSQASTSTVFLEHWDYIMTNENTPYNVETDEDFTPTAKADENNLVYDTIRDITLSFEFTSKANSEASYENIVWKVDKEMNDSRKFIDSFNIDYGEEDPLGETSIKKDVLSIINPAKDTSSIDEDLLELMKKLGDNKDIYKCYEFAPGKCWVEVEVKNASGSVIGGRKLRLLPMAFADAGNYTEITIGEKGKNSIVYSKGEKKVQYEGDTYKHQLDTIYSITSAENLGTDSNYKSQQVTKSTDTNFAMWGRYPAEQNKGTKNEIFDSLYDQKMIGDAVDRKN